MKLKIKESEEGRHWVQIALWRLPSERLSVPKENGVNRKLKRWVGVEVAYAVYKRAIELEWLRQFDQSSSS
jgi:hypothetical protein